eukprot:m51a1_g2096 putative adenylate guanylate cyclase domain-containing protein (491) ;mRNA; r:1562808-1565161
MHSRRWLVLLALAVAARALGPGRHERALQGATRVLGLVPLRTAEEVATAARVAAGLGPPGGVLAAINSHREAHAPPTDDRQRPAATRGTHGGSGAAFGQRGALVDMAYCLSTPSCELAGLEGERLRPLRGEAAHSDDENSGTASGSTSLNAILITAICIGGLALALFVLVLVLIFMRSYKFKNRFGPSGMTLVEEPAALSTNVGKAIPAETSSAPGSVSSDDSEVCFVFTGVQNETTLDSSLREKMLTVYHKVLRACFQRCGGTELAAHDGSFMYAFNSTQSAVTASLEVQLQMLSANWPKEVLSYPDYAEEHSETSTALLYRGARSYSGLTVRRAYKVAAASSGGQILITSVVYNRAKSLLDNNPQVSLQWLGSIEQPETVWQILPSSLAGRTFLPLAAPKKSWIFPGAVSSIMQTEASVPHVQHNAVQQDDKQQEHEQAVPQWASATPSSAARGRPAVPPLDMGRVFAYQRYYRARLFNDAAKANNHQ